MCPASRTNVHLRKNAAGFHLGARSCPRGCSPKQAVQHGGEVCVRRSRDADQVAHPTEELRRLARRKKPHIRSRGHPRFPWPEGPPPGGPSPFGPLFSPQMRCSFFAHMRIQSHTPAGSATLSRGNDRPTERPGKGLSRSQSYDALPWTTCLSGYRDPVTGGCRERQRWNG